MRRLNDAIAEYERAPQKPKATPADEPVGTPSPKRSNPVLIQSIDGDTEFRNIVAKVPKDRGIEAMEYLKYLI